MKSTYTVDPWKIIEDRFDPEQNEVSESVFSTANEYFGTRGLFEEGSTGLTMEGCYIGGIYQLEKAIHQWKRPCFPEFSNMQIHTTNWLRTRVRVDGETFSMDGSCFDSYQRVLDLKNGTLVRELVFTTKSGAKTHLAWERIVSYDDRHMAGIRLSITALNHRKKIGVSLLLDGRDRLGHYPETGEYAAFMDRFYSIHHTSGPHNVSLAMKVPSVGHSYIHRMDWDSNGIEKLDESYVNEDRLVGYAFSFMPETGQSYPIDKLVCVWTSRDMGHPYGLNPADSTEDLTDNAEAARTLDFLVTQSGDNIARYADRGFDALKKNHVENISRLWESFDVEIEGDDLSQQSIRFCTFQLLNSFAGNDGFLNIGPKQYTGEKYHGRAMWDTECYCFPFYVFANPVAARKLLEYRYNTLERAKERAQLFGYRGAFYPWDTIDGTDDELTWEYGQCQVHINGIIPYAIYLYTKGTGDTSYLYEKGIEVLIEESRFWQSRSAYIPYRKGRGINAVLGPDEFQQLVNNNYYTNYIAKWTMEYTSHMLEQIAESSPGSYQAARSKTGLQDTEVAAWKTSAAQMILPADEEMDIFVQDDGYLSAYPLAIEELDRKKDMPIEGKWPIEKYLRYNITKQADVVLSLVLFRDKYSMAEKRRNYDFYEQRTIHGSSLSTAMHSILASEIGRYTQAYNYYLRSSRLDLDDFNNDTKEGLHISSMGGTLLTIFYGFGGITLADDGIRFAPVLPEAWERLSFKFHYQGRVLSVKMDRHSVHLAVVDGADLPVTVYRRSLLLTKTETTVDVPMEIMEKAAPQAVLFDLDGVLVDTAKFHYLAWKQIADREGIAFDHEINEQLKGVSRQESLRIILRKSPKSHTDEQVAAMAEDKNATYLKMVQEGLSAESVLPGILNFLDELKMHGIKTAIYSVSKNTPLILEKLGIASRFDTVVDGNAVTKSKPDPEGFLLAAERLGIRAANCVVIEDSFAGLQAAEKAGMKSIGVGDKIILNNATRILPATEYLTSELLLSLF